MKALTLASFAAATAILCACPEKTEEKKADAVNAVPPAPPAPTPAAPVPAPPAGAEAAAPIPGAPAPAAPPPGGEHEKKAGGW